MAFRASLVEDEEDFYEVEPDFDEEDEEETDFDHDYATSGTQPGKKRLRGAGKVWMKEREFATKAEAVEFVKSEGCWSTDASTHTIEGNKVYFRCNLVRNHTPDRCPAGVHLLYYADREAVGLFRTLSAHDHVGRKPAARGLAPDIRNAITDLYNSGAKKPNAIMAGLQLKGIPQPTFIQLRNFLQAMKRKRTSSISFDDFDLWCSQRLDVPDDPDKIFVVKRSSGVDANRDVCVRIFLSTPRLLGFASRSNVVHANATYRINWNRFPVFLVGTSDCDRQFFPFGIGICSGDTATDFGFAFQAVVDGVRNVYNVSYEPNVLIADASDAITDGFRLTFGDDFKRVVCSFHAVEILKKKSEKIQDQASRQRIRDDVFKYLQLCPSKEVFDAVAPLFFSKWSHRKDAEILEFLAYFRSDWIERHCNWYEGYALSTSSSNHALELVETNLASEQTLRAQLPLARFLDLVEEHVLTPWSTASREKSFAEVPTKTTAIWSKAYEWAVESTAILSKRLSGSTAYFIQAGTRPLNPAMIDSYRSKFGFLQWKSFDEYVQTRDTLWIVTMPDSEWEKAICNCPTFLKEFICAHSLGVAIRKKYCEPPLSILATITTPKRKRGRPKQAPALTRDRI